jgi:electron transfer flavoprotein alpha subunit
MEKKKIAVIATHKSNELLPALEAALILRDESPEEYTVCLIALGTNDSAADSAREALFRGADSALVVSDPLLEGIDEATLINIVSEQLTSQYSTIITSGTGSDYRPRNAHRVLRYKRALTDSELGPDTPYRHLYDEYPHLRIPSCNIRELGLCPETFILLNEGLNSSSNGDERWGKGSAPIVVNYSEESHEWLERIAQLLNAYRPSRSSRRLRDAQLVVGGGYGIGSAEGFERLSEFATEIRAKMGATRAAIDSEFCPAKLMIGPTGERIKPKVYIACGISGQIQHMAGIAENTTIIAINTDPEAPIIEQADLSIIGPVEEVIPKLLECYRAVRNR